MPPAWSRWRARSPRSPNAAASPSSLACSRSRRRSSSAQGSRGALGASKFVPISWLGSAPPGTTSLGTLEARSNPSRRRSAIPSAVRPQRGRPDRSGASSWASSALRCRRSPNGRGCCRLQPVAKPSMWTLGLSTGPRFSGLFGRIDVSGGAKPAWQRKPTHAPQLTRDPGAIRVECAAVALSATVYHLQIELSDVDRGVYEALDLRLGRHPSETMRYLLTRVIAYCLCYEEGIFFFK